MIECTCPGTPPGTGTGIDLRCPQHGYPAAVRLERRRAKDLGFEPTGGEVTPLGVVVFVLACLLVIGPLVLYLAR